MCSCTCNRQQADETIVENDIIATTDYTTRLGEYSSLLAGMDTGKMDNSRLAAEKFNTFFNGADAQLADSAFVLFVSFHEGMFNKLSDGHYKDATTANAFTFVPPDSIQPTTSKAQKYLDNLRANGFALDFSEGNTYIQTDKDFYIQHFHPLLSAAMRTYLEQLNKEDKEGFMNDGAMVITPTVLARRIIYWDEFINQNPSFVFNEQVAEKQRERITFLLEGVDNTPLYNYPSKELSKEYKEAYDFVLQKHPESKLYTLLFPYYDALKSNTAVKVKKILEDYRKREIILDFSG